MLSPLLSSFELLPSSGSTSILGLSSSSSGLTSVPGLSSSSGWSSPSPGSSGISSPSPNLVISRVKSLVANPIASSLLLNKSGLILFSSVGSIWTFILFNPRSNLTSWAKLPFSSTSTCSWS